MFAAIHLGSVQDSSCMATRLCSMRFHICASPSHLGKHGKPETPRHISQCECLLFPRREHNLNWLFRDKSGEVQEVTINGRCLVTNSEVIRRCALAGMGLALLPEWLVEADIRSGKLLPLFEEFEGTATDFYSAVWILHPSREYMPLRARVFIEQLTSSIAGNVDSQVLTHP